MCAKTDQSLPNSQALITKSTAAGNLAIVDPLNGSFQVSLTTADTQAFLDTGVVPLDFLISDPLGNVFTVANNTRLEIKANYSRVLSV